MDDSQVDEFCAVTGTSRERAEFFLQAAAGNLQAAIDAFYGEEVNELICNCTIRLQLVIKS